jgi:hypothetical protein
MTEISQLVKKRKAALRCEAPARESFAVLGINYVIAKAKEGSK